MDGPPLVLVVEDHALLARGIRRALSRTSTPRVATTVAEALSLLDSDAHWVAAIVDVGLPDGSGLTVVRRARELFPLLPVLVLTGRDDVQVVNESHALRVELACKPVDREELVRFVAGALSLGYITDVRIREQVERLAADAHLTPREAQIVALTLSRKSRGEILAELGVSENTLKTQVKGLLRKTGHDSMTALTRSLLTDLLNPE